MQETTRVTELLAAMSAGRPEAMDQLIVVVYDELRRLARSRLAREHSAQAPETTSLVHQAYVRLATAARSDWRDRSHFLAAASEAMRRVLVDLARERCADKRGGGRQPLALAELGPIRDVRASDLLDIDHALSRLERRDSDLATVVKLRYFAGLSVEETARATETSPRTIDRQWAAARAWLQREIKRL